MRKRPRAQQRSLEACNKVFVYGTLKSGEQNNWRLENSSANRLPGFYESIIEYPLVSTGLLPVLLSYPTRGRKVKGEVWEVSDRCLDLLDRIEGHPHMYRREELVVAPLCDPDEHMTTWAYFFPSKLSLLAHTTPRSWWTGCGQSEPV